MQKDPKGPCNNYLGVWGGGGGCKIRGGIGENDSKREEGGCM